MNISSAAEHYYDRLWDRLCDAEEEAEAAGEMGMTVAEFRQHCADQKQEAAIEAYEWSKHD